MAVIINTSSSLSSSSSAANTNNNTNTNITLGANAEDSNLSPSSTKDQALSPLLPSSTSNNSSNSSPSHAPPSDASLTLSLSLGLLLLLYGTQHMWSLLFSGSTFSGNFVFWSLASFLLFRPRPSALWLRAKLLWSLKVVLEAFRGERTFLHVLAADMLCSLSKVFYDVGTLLGLLLHRPHRPAPGSAASHLPPLLAAVPFLLRARQCLSSYNGSFGRGGRPLPLPPRQRGLRRNPPHLHLLNLLKYVSSLLPLAASFLRSTSDEPEEWDGTVLLLLVVNTAACAGWDVVMDWGIVDFSGGEKRAGSGM